ncbi:hypothetical protein [Streptococcus ovis]|uniref:hypothetical protein n=1 Tax=Streptococcus ovis TaxID=82806 RepID=UPI00036AB85A|nr:hypothetical protein [Streptococcus ovis]
MQNKQNIVKNQLLFIFVVGVMTLVAFVSAVKSDASTFRWVAWISFTLLAILFFLLVWGLKSAKKIQEKIDRGDVADKEVRQLQKVPVYDERQQQFVLKSYQLGFWFMVFVLWLESFTIRLFPLVSASFMSFVALWGGVAISVAYANLKGASPFVDKRFGKIGKIIALPIALFGVIVVAMTLIASVVAGLGWADFFAQGGSGSMVLMGLSLFVTGSSIAYRHYLDKREEE